MHLLPIGFKHGMIAVLNQPKPFELIARNLSQPVFSRKHDTQNFTCPLTLNLTKALQDRYDVLLVFGERMNF